MGKYITDFIRPHHLHAKTNQFRNAFDIFEEIQFIACAGKSDAATTMPADILAGSCFKIWVHRIAVMMHLGHIVVSDETWTLAGCMPGRSGCQFTLFD